MLADILGYNPQQPTQIGTLRVDIVRSSEYQYEQEVPSHPVENGFEIHDTIVNKPFKVNMQVGISSHPVTWIYVNGIGKSKFDTGLAALEAIRDAKIPVTIVRPDKIMTDMVLTSCRYSKSDQSRSIIWCDLAFTHIQKVVVETVAIPDDIVDASVKDSAGETTADGGAATQTNVSTDSVTAEKVGEVQDNMEKPSSWLKQTKDAAKNWLQGK